MKSKILVVLALPVILAGCSLGIGGEEGVLVLSMSEIVSPRTIQPDLDMNPFSYDVEGEGPGGRTFEQTGVESETIVQTSLIPGEWTIAVTARNADGDAIGDGRVTVTVEAGRVTSATVTVRPFDGEGTLDVTVTWPAGVLTTPEIAATVAPAGSNPGDIAFVPGTDSSAHTEDYDDGYYVLNLRLIDEGDIVWGTVEAVRIVAGQISAELFALEEDVNRGGLALTVETEMDNPITVTLDGPDTIPEGSDELVTATTSEPVDVYQWYLQGAPVGTDADTILIGDGLGLGHYWLSLVVTKGSIASSATLKFEVVEASAEPVLDVDTSLPWSASDIYNYGFSYSDRSAQGFIPTMSGELARAEVYVYSSNASPIPTDFEIYTADSTGRPTGTPIASGTGTIPGGTGLHGLSDKWVTLALPEPRPVLVAGQPYAVAIVTSGFVGSTGATSAFGEAFRNSLSSPGSWYGTYGNPDMQIRTYMIP